MSGPEIDETTGRIKYIPDGDVLEEFLFDDSEVSIIQGPWGSGKSAGCCLKIWRYMEGQAPQHDGMRRTRWCVVRNTYGELQETTVKTWLDWFPESTYGTFIKSKPPRHEIRVGDVEADVIFMALDDEEDRKKLLSLEMTGFWFNELREIPKGIIDDATGRLRYPAMKDGGATWSGIIGDTNAPSETHWLPIMRGDVPPPEEFDEDQRSELKKPDSWSLYVQPAGMLEIRDDLGAVIGYKDNPQAENAKNLPVGYYSKMVVGKAKSWIDVNILNKLGSSHSGKPVFPMYRPELHLAKKPLEWNPNIPLLCGIDFGRQPAALFGQNLRGVWYILHEFMGHDMGATTFAPLLKGEMARRFPGVRPEQVQFWGDPAGDDGGQNDEQTPYQIFRTHGLHVRPAPGNNRLNIRLEAVEMVLNKLIEGKPALQVSPTCTVFKTAMAGGYRFEKLKTNVVKYDPLPFKGDFSHIADAGQYLLLGGGEGRNLAFGAQSGRAKPVDTARRTDVFSRGR